MNKVIYIGKKNIFSLESADFENVTFCKYGTVNEASDVFGSQENIVLLVAESECEGEKELIQELRKDEVYHNMPIIILCSHYSPKAKLEYLLLGVDGIFFVDNNDTKKDVVSTGRILIAQWLKLKDFAGTLRVKQEENIKKSLQLEILRKLISSSTWSDTQAYSQGNIVHTERICKVAIVFLEVDCTALKKENVVAKDVFSQINNVFSIATKTIYEHFGDVDKFINNNLLAVFKNVDCAILSACLIKKQVDEFNRLHSNEGCSLNVRVGINYGVVIRGNIGLLQRSDNTIIGDVVNTCQRIKSASEYGDILISKDAVKRSCLGKLDMSFDSYKLKGKENNVKVVSIKKNIQFWEQMQSKLNKIYVKYEKYHSQDKYYV